jgi:hypothetical protein
MSRFQHLLIILSIFSISSICKKEESSDDDIESISGAKNCYNKLLECAALLDKLYPYESQYKQSQLFMGDFKNNKKVQDVLFRVLRVSFIEREIDKNKKRRLKKKLFLELGRFIFDSQKTRATISVIEQTDLMLKLLQEKTRSHCGI